MWYWLKYKITRTNYILDSNGAKTSPSRHNIIDETLNELFDDRTGITNLPGYGCRQLPVVENPQFCEQLVGFLL